MFFGEAFWSMYGLGSGMCEDNQPQWHPAPGYCAAWLPD